MKNPRLNKRLRLILIFLTITIAANRAAFARPMLFRTQNVPCDLSVDGVQVGSIGDAYFLRVETVPGAHIIQCTGTYKLSSTNSGDPRTFGLPYSISTTVYVADAPQQAIIDLPDPIINFDDVVRITGSLYLTATVESANDVLGPGCSVNKFQEKVGLLDDKIAEADHRVWNHKRDDILQDIACSDGSDKKDCDEAYRNVIDHIKDAEDDKKMAQSNRSTWVSLEIDFKRRLATEEVSLFTGPPETCGGRRFAKIYFEGDSFLVPVGFVIRSHRGGAFHLR